MIARAAVAVLAVASAGCAAAIDPYCSDVNDPTGRGIPLCRDLRAQPVCDLPGMTASFQPDAMGVVRLVGGTPALCDDARQVVCADRTILPRCLHE